MTTGDQRQTGVDSLIADVKQLSLDRLRSRRWTVRLSLACVTMAAVCLMVLLLGPSDRLEGRWLGLATSWPLGAIAGCFFTCALQLLDQWKYRRLVDLSRQLAAAGRVEAIGPLLDCLHRTWGETQTPILKALSVLLPLVSCSDNPLIGARHCSALAKYLHGPNDRWPERDGRDASFRRGALSALEQLGWFEAIPDVRALVQSEEWWASPAKESARRCLQALERDEQRARLTGTLLRPAESPESPDLLLRPAHGTTTELERILLRAAEPGG